MANKHVGTPAGAEAPVGVVFPSVDGARSTSAFGRAVVAEALEGADPVGARAARAETAWRSGYLPHFRRLVEAGIGTPVTARVIAASGVAVVADGMRWADPATGEEVALASYAHAGPGPLVPTETVVGKAEPVREFGLPVRGEVLSGRALDRQLDAWVTAGVIEPSVSDAVRVVAAHPEWLSLPGRTLVALGAASEIGPTPTLLRWGARVAGLDLRRADLWQRVIASAEGAAGTLLVPAAPGAGPLAERAGLNLLTQLPAITEWVAAVDGPVVLGNYLYADGGVNVRVSAASDALATRLQSVREDVMLAYLATPTDVFAVPSDAVDHAVNAYATRPRRRGVLGRGLRAMTGGRLLRPAYLPGADPGICDSLVPQQGPNYALGKRLQRWRATTEVTAERRVSMNVAPPTRTRSVVKNRALAAAYAGAHRFGVEVFDPSTTRVLMAALLVHDVYADIPSFEHPWQHEAHQAVHGGLWRAPYEPRSALGLAALLGYGAGGA